MSEYKRSHEDKFYMIKILRKRMSRESEKAYSFHTTGYGGQFFSIPKSQIIYKDFDDPEFIRMKVTSFIFNAVKEELQSMDQKEIKVTPL